MFLRDEAQGYAEVWNADHAVDAYSEGEENLHEVGGDTQVTQDVCSLRCCVTEGDGMQGDESEDEDACCTLQEEVFVFPEVAFAG